ncbi:MAG TPA: response regulator transcription factor [Alphaproteobacteria bacterium]|nr:response regulator transcription factor [Alphaproteobacteria bacterium]
MKILVVEDDPETADYVVNGLREEGHLVEQANTGRVGLYRTSAEKFDMLVIDRMIPDIDGLTLVKTLRSAGNRTPVLFLTTLAGVNDRVAGLNAGGDDYLVKPFALVELVARIMAIARRPPAMVNDAILHIADLELDRLARTVKRAGKPIDLQPREFQLLEYLMLHSGQVVTRTMMFENIWELHFDPHTNVVDSHISRLRGKINRASPVELIHTVRGAGYCIRAPA